VRCDSNAARAHLSRTTSRNSAPRLARRSPHCRRPHGAARTGAGPTFLIPLHGRSGSVRLPRCHRHQPGGGNASTGGSTGSAPKAGRSRRSSRREPSTRSPLRAHVSPRCVNSSTLLDWPSGTGSKRRRSRRATRMGSPKVSAKTSTAFVVRTGRCARSAVPAATARKLWSSAGCGSRGSTHRLLA
jgi:hypothetical protein